MLEPDWRPLSGLATVYIVDDEACVRDLTRLLLKTVGLEATTFASPVEFLEKFDPDRPSCVVLDLRMPELNGIETLARLRERHGTVPVIFRTGYSELSAVIRAMKLGAVDFFEKPVSNDLLLESIQHWIQYDIKAYELRRQRKATWARLAKLSARQRQVLDCVLNGMSNKETARHLGVSPKAIEIHRALLMRKMEASNVVKLVVKAIGCLNFANQPDALAPLLHSNKRSHLIDGA